VGKLRKLSLSQSRAALISMADDLAATRRVLEETKRLSWRYIWEEEMKPWLTQAGKPTLPPPNPEKPPLIPEPEPEASAETAPPAASIKPVCPILSHGLSAPTSAADT
jgi:hypothetical protein